MIDSVILIGSVATALLAIGALVGKLFHKLNIVIKMFKDIQEKTYKNYMNNLKLVIMSDEMPIEERLRAGKEYVDHDGNGQVKAFYHKLEAEYKESIHIHD